MWEGWREEEERKKWWVRKGGMEEGSEEGRGGGEGKRKGGREDVLQVTRCSGVQTGQFVHTCIHPHVHI